MKSSLSIIIPTFHRKDSVLRLLRALEKQKDPEPEIIVVDQNAPGELDAIFAQVHTGRVKRLMLATPNVSDARNRGFMASQGDIVLFIDDDLVPGSDFCARGLEIFSKHPGIDCFSPLVYNAEGRELALWQAGTRRAGVYPGDPSIFPITDTLSAAIFFRRPYFSRTGGFDPMLFDYARATEDQEFFLRMRKKGLVLYMASSVDVFHDEQTPGGCELRTEDYWKNRERCMKGWAYRYRIHHHPPGSLSTHDLFLMARSSFLNKEALTSGFKDIGKQIGLLKRSNKATAEYLKTRIGQYAPVEDMDHLKHLS